MTFSSPLKPEGAGCSPERMSRYTYLAPLLSAYLSPLLNSFNLSPPGLTRASQPRYSIPMTEETGLDEQRVPNFEATSTETLIEKNDKPDDIPNRPDGTKVEPS